MSTIEEQLELEQRMIDRGAATYLDNQRKAEKNGRGAELDYSRKLMKDFIQPLAEALTELVNKKAPGKHGLAKQHLKKVNPESAMFIALKGLFNSFSMDEKLAATCSNIGRKIEDEIRFTSFEALYENYYQEIINDFKRKGTKDYRYQQRVLTNTANKVGDGWNAWATAEKVDVGARLLSIILENTDLAKKVTYYKQGGSYVTIEPTETAKEWINDHEAVQQFLYPDKAPCIIPPDNWTGLNSGGYYGPRMRATTPMVKAGSKRHKKLLADASLTNIKEALNLVQGTPWRVNTKILEIVKIVWARGLQIGMPSSQKLDIPPSPFEKVEGQVLTPEQEAELQSWKREAADVYTQEKDRVSKSFQVSRILRLANDYAAYNNFWYVWYYDFRGRMYTATSGFSPQGPDLAKGLLKFGRGKALGSRGLFWLMVHIANRYGYDKCTYEERVAWVKERHDVFVACAMDPLSHRETWANADKPWQFLAALMEYKEVHDCIALGINEQDYVSHLPIGLDGSCNGLQNFSAMLRDPIGGQATNLTPSERPADIYSQVASVCHSKLQKRSGEALGGLWLRWATDIGGGKLPRSLAKRPVMTLPYGATRQSCTDYIFQHIMENDKDFFGKKEAFNAAVYLSPILWESIGEVVVAARVAMKWLQDAATVISKTNKPITWQTADGFIATQHARVLQLHRIDTQLNGRMTMQVGTYTDEINARQQRSGIAPNFIHSQDAQHLRTTVRLAARSGISDFACIHDDYGTHACDTDTLHKCIRNAFVVLYEKSDPLDLFKKQQESANAVKLKDVPAKGTLDIRDVLKSEFFFG